MSLIDEALRRAQAARRPADPGGPASPDPLEAAPLPDARRARRRLRAAAASGIAILLLAGGAALVRARHRDRSAASPPARSKISREQPPPGSGRAAEAIATPPRERAWSARPVPNPPGEAATQALVAAVTAAQPAASARRSDRTAAERIRLEHEATPLSKPASSSPRIAAPLGTGGPLARPHTAAAGGVAERPRATHAGEVSIPGGHIELGGIVYSETNPVAVLNGRVVGVGGIVDGFTVVSIEESRVELRNDHRTIVLTLR